MILRDNCSLSKADLYCSRNYCMLGFFTPIHVITTFPFAGVFAYAAIRMQNNLNRKQVEEEQLEEEQQIEEVRSPESVISLLTGGPY